MVQKKMTDLLGPELEAVVSLLVHVLRIKCRSSGRAESNLKL